MNPEIIYFSLNLSLFLTTIYSIVSIKNKYLDRIKNFIFYFILSIIFYTSFSFSNIYNIEIFRLKSNFFNHYAFLFVILVLLVSLFLPKNIESRIGKISLGFISLFLYFFLFGIEEFIFLGEKFAGLKLLKTQNPMIGFFCILILLIPFKQIQILGFSLVFSILFYLYYPKKNHVFEDKNIFQMYIPSELYKDDYYIVEEEQGIYVEKKANLDDIYYKFSMKKLKIENPKLKKEIQFYISTFNFPIIFIEDEYIMIYELSRNFKNENFKVIFDLKNNQKEIKGPIF